ncbi:hypothetical protein ZHAS_00007488 [Anopheles sinensis]|uniref:Uncharacterized protein n=1 Tax=Anopheles sinensis TaxID=74873 RepID=A0A084VPY5_ANOSI|nr:hypothetical protein ZHAS_00007488 [Anopheles sinensis]
MPSGLWSRFSPPAHPPIGTGVRHTLPRAGYSPFGPFPHTDKISHSTSPKTTSGVECRYKIERELSFGNVQIHTPRRMIDRSDTETVDRCEPRPAAFGIKIVLQCVRPIGTSPTHHWFLVDQLDPCSYEICNGLTNQNGWRKISSPP